jgi:hypothetical protein
MAEGLALVGAVRYMLTEEIYICSSRLGLIKMDHRHSGNGRNSQQLSAQQKLGHSDEDRKIKANCNNDNKRSDDDDNDDSQETTAVTNGNGYCKWKWQHKH